MQSPCGLFICCLPRAADGWKTICQNDIQAFWKGQDAQEVFASQKAKYEIEKEFAYVAVVFLREAGYLDRHNRAAKTAISNTKMLCPLESSNSLFTFKLNTRKLVAEATKQRPLINKDGGYSLETSSAILRRYIVTVFGPQLERFEDYLFQPVMTLERTLSFGALWYPTPTGWEWKSFQDYINMWGMIDMEDQLPSEKVWTRADKLVVGFSYMTVMRLQELGCLDDNCQPCLNEMELQATKEKSLLRERNGLPVPPFSSSPPPSIVAMSEDSSLSDLCELFGTGSGGGEMSIDASTSFTPMDVDNHGQFDDPENLQASSAGVVSLDGQFDVVCLNGQFDDASSASNHC